MISPLAVPPVDLTLILILWFFAMLFVVVVFYVGLKLVKKLRDRYLAVISLMYWIVALAVYFASCVQPPLDPFRGVLALSIYPIIFSNIALDIAFLLGYNSRRIPS